MKRSQLNVVLGLAVVGLLVLVWIGRDREPDAEPLTGLADADVRHIAFTVHDDPAIELHREGGRWMLTAPVSAEADPSEVASLLRVARQSVAKRFPAAEVSLAELGLDPPQTVIRFNDVEVSLGGVDPVTFRRYALIGDEVVQIDDPAGAPQNTDHSNFVAKAIVPEGARLVRIELPDLIAVRQEEGGWSLSPERADVDSDRVQALADAWAQARGMWTALASSADTGGERVRLTLDSGEEIELLVNAREPQLILVRPDYRVRYHVSRAQEATLLRLPDEQDADAALEALQLPDFGTPATP
jgi:hypothetical protein